ncbi:MAG: putative quinol monooxygenase [Candidatus Dormibacteraceae bacterium]
MAYVVAATYTAKSGEEGRVQSILGTMAPLSREEPGCRFYQAHRSPEDPTVFFLYEQYDDENAYRQHQETPHFKEHILGEAIPRLASRERAFYITL